MELYIKSEGVLKETTLSDVLKQQLRAAGFDMDNGSFSDENHNWIGIIQERKGKNAAQITVNITLDDDGNTITGVKVYEAPIRKVIDEDNSKQIV